MTEPRGSGAASATPGLEARPDPADAGLRIGVIGLPASWSSEHLADAIARRTGVRLLLDPADLSCDTSEGAVRAGPVDLLGLDGLVVKKAGLTYGPQLLDRLELLRAVEEAGVPCFSSPTRSLALLSRLSCTITLRRAGLPVPATVVTESPLEAEAAVRRLGEAVLKPLYSTKARGMRVVRAEQPDLALQLEAFRQEGNPVYYVQQRVDHQGRDLAVVFLGAEHLGTYARVGAPGQWNTTIAAGGRYEPCVASDEVLALARRAQRLFGLDFTSVDVVETAAGEALLFEVSAFGGFNGLRAVGVPAAERYAEYVCSRVRATSCSRTSSGSSSSRPARGPAG